MAWHFAEHSCGDALGKGEEGMSEPNLSHPKVFKVIKSIRKFPFQTWSLHSVLPTCPNICALHNTLNANKSNRAVPLDIISILYWPAKESNRLPVRKEKFDPTRHQGRQSNVSVPSLDYFGFYALIYTSNKEDWVFNYDVQTLLYKPQKRELFFFNH